MRILGHAAPPDISHNSLTLFTFCDALTGETPFPSATPSPFPTTGSPATPTSSPLPTLLEQNITLTNSSKIPICKVDPNGFFIPPNDPRYTAPTTRVLESSEVTFEDAQDALGDIDNYLGAVAVADEIGVLEQLAKFSSFAAAIGPAAAIAGSAVAILGPMLGLKSQDDILLDAIMTGFQQITSQLNTIQFELRAGFLELAVLIGDVALDELASRLTAHQRAFNAFVNATDATQSLYETRWRAVCNTPLLTPEDLFYDLYGYVCDKCTFGSRKRADFYDKALKSNPNSGSTFLSAFANFMLRGMSQALTLHSLCPPITEGSCADRAIDAQWSDGVRKMQQAMDESISRISNDVTALDDFVPKILADHAALDEIEKATSENQELANRFRDFFVERQPQFYFQILVSTRANRAEFWRRTTDVTVSDGTGHFKFDFEKRSVSIRYRKKSLPPPVTTVIVGGQTLNFNDFHQGTVSRLQTVDDANANAADIDGGCVRDFGALACTVPHCFLCSPEEQAAYDGVVGRFFIGRTGWDGFDLKEASDKEDFFPRYDVSFSLTYSTCKVRPFDACCLIVSDCQSTANDSFRFYYV